jgi:hypothetical protein
MCSEKHLARENGGQLALQKSKRTSSLTQSCNGGLLYLIENGENFH